MIRVRYILACALLAVLVASVVYGILLMRAATAVVEAIPGEIRDTRSALVEEVQATRRGLLAEVDGQASGIRRDAVGQIVALRTDTLARVDTLTAVLDRRTGEALGIADSRLSGAVGALDGVRGDLHPILTNVASVTAHADEAAAVLLRRDALPAQTLGLIAAAKVTAGETAQTMRTVRDAAPKLAESAVGVGKSADGIAADIHAITADIAKPKTFWARFRAWLETAGKIGARFL
jgi:hypothetical protein